MTLFKNKSDLNDAYVLASDYVKLANPRKLFHTIAKVNFKVLFLNIFALNVKAVTTKRTKTTKSQGNFLPFIRKIEIITSIFVERKSGGALGAICFVVKQAKQLTANWNTLLTKRISKRLLFLTRLLFLMQTYNKIYCRFKFSK